MLFKGYDFLSNGEVWHNGKKLKPQPNSKGYLRVRIDNKNIFVHRMVAQMFVPNPENKPQVNHIDGNKLNNDSSNLEWVTNSENRAHALANGLQTRGTMFPQSKLTEKDVLYIREHFIKGKHGNSKQLAEKFGVGRLQICKIARGDAWSWL